MEKNISVIDVNTEDDRRPSTSTLDYNDDEVFNEEDEEDNNGVAYPSLASYLLTLWPHNETEKKKTECSAHGVRIEWTYSFITACDCYNLPDGQSL